MRTTQILQSMLRRDCWQQFSSATLQVGMILEIWPKRDII
ncbi:hypothetical protein FOYG_13219 [Fusarium oxysporum NRRL 32931]|uniref:Uncharacterized protein n=1 Tax=Fusarium oxysporum NRRL 32931 TaxID=660029 RepID=W9HQY1_FUSOX|nr:hypothetical protein FOYG_13219 [Fusarium oxysporum NRRL 32931]